MTGRFSGCLRRLDSPEALCWFSRAKLGAGYLLQLQVENSLIKLNIEPVGRTNVQVAQELPACQNVVDTANVTPK